MWAALAVIGLVLVVWLLVTMRPSGTEGTPQPSSTPTEFAEQQTLLIQVRNDADLGANNMVAGVGGGLPAAQLLVPSRLIVDVPGAGQQTLGQSARLLDRTASQDALSDLLALRIDGTLSLARLALAGMVDFVGGITIDVDTTITTTDEATGIETVVVPAGTQTLDGNQAAAYALAWLPDEPEAARLARYSQVMTATISRLPDDVLRVEQMLTSLGASARTTTSSSAVAATLLQMRHGILEGGQQVRVLPTTDIEAGETLAVVRVDLVAAESVINSLLPQAMLTGAESNPRVLVQNGVGTPGLGASARDRLVGAGMVYINGGNAEQFNQEQTLVIVEDATTGSVALGSEVAEALGVPTTSVQVAEDGQNVADVVVILGADFEP
ncbi:MAG TPA: LCP family protein [Motilibacterales bacterium]|nr:LCP family protein [Motilibacterales bacterium]